MAQELVACAVCEDIFLLYFYASLREIASPSFYPCQKVWKLAVRIYDGRVTNQFIFYNI